MPQHHYYSNLQITPPDIWALIETLTEIYGREPVIREIASYLDEFVIHFDLPSGAPCRLEWEKEVWELHLEYASVRTSRLIPVERSVEALRSFMRSYSNEGF